MEFIIPSITGNQNLLNKNKYITLTTNKWNDYNFETTFHMHLVENGRKVKIGDLHILHSDNKITRKAIPGYFEKIEANFISLGYDIDYYENLIKHLTEEAALEVLRALNDISIEPLDNNPYFEIDHPGIVNSFFRRSEGRYLYENVNSLLFKLEEINDTNKMDYQFIFKTFFDRDNDKNITDIKINFKKESEVPYRIFTIIGKNGVGKTTFLNQLSNALYDSSNEGNINRFIIDGEFKIPSYHKIIAISFIVYDRFFKGADKGINGNNVKKKLETSTENYHYIGLSNRKNETYTIEDLKKINKKAFALIRNKEDRIGEDIDREQLLVDTINRTKILEFELKKGFDYNIFYNEEYSSGQIIFISLFTRLISQIEKGTLIFLMNQNYIYILMQLLH